MNMINRVARGLYAGEPGRLRNVPPWDEAVRRFPELPERYRAMARSAIAAMREPTKAMCFVNGPGDQHREEDAEAEGTWKKMIDEALK